MLEAWNWPQWYFAFCMGLLTLIESGMHGKDRVGKYNAPMRIIGTAWVAFVLYMGGFWS